MVAKRRASKAVRHSKKGLPVGQKQRIRRIFRYEKEIERLSRKIQTLNTTKHKTILTILNEIEKNPERYYYKMRKGKKTETQSMTLAKIKQIKAKYKKRAGAAVLKISGPGCDDCEDLKNCICVFGAGPLCCYICLSPGVIQCYF